MKAEDMTFSPSKRVQTVSPFIVMDVMRAAAAREAQGLPVYHMEVGQPGTGAPKAALDALAGPLATQSLGYTEAFGRPDLRAALAEHYQEAYGARVPTSQIAITAGSSAGFSLAFISAFEAGDRVALASPGYPAYRNILTALGLEVVEIPVDAEHGFQPQIDQLEALVPLQGLILASPSNPTGTMVSPEELKAMAEYCHKSGIRLISDEIYHGLSYDKPEATALAYSPSAIVVNSFSKYYSMTGWRVGWLILPQDLVRSVDRLTGNMFICAPHVAQVVALGALKAKPELDALKTTYAQNRQIVLDGLDQAGIKRMAPPDGAFYVYAEVGHLTDDSLSFCQDILAQTGLAITPGIDFDPARGRGFVRFSFCGSSQTVTDGMQAFQDYVSRL